MKLTPRFVLGHQSLPSLRGMSVSSFVLHRLSHKSFREMGKKNVRQTCQGFDRDHYFVLWAWGDPSLRKTVWVFPAPKVGRTR